MLVAIICILSVLVVILGFSTLNLMRKQEKAEDVLMEYLAYLDKLSRVIEASDKKLKEIDTKGTFKSDDEIGFFFKSVQQIQDILNEFKVIRIKQE
jgi:competence protein ComGF